MYDELVKRLREPCQYENCVLCQQAADAIEELSMKLHGDEAAIAGMKREIERMVVSGNMPRWIPVTERLPESGVPTLICGDGNVVEQGFFDDEYGYWYDWGGNRTFVHHWMPLPQPPKEE